MKLNSIVSLLVLAISLFAVPTYAQISRTVFVNQIVTITVVANGTPPFTYQWQKLPLNAPPGTVPTVLQGSPYSQDYISPSLIQQLDIKGSGIYSVVITNTEGSITSDPVILTVIRNVQFALVINSPSSVALGVTYIASVTGGSGNGSVIWTLGSGSTAPGAAIDQWTGVVSFTGPGTVVFHATKSQTNVYESASTPDFTLTILGIPPTIASLTVTVN